MKNISIKIKNDDTLSIDLGGDLNRGCCGCEARHISEELEKLGVRLKIQRINCRLPVQQRIMAKASGECNAVDTLTLLGLYAKGKVGK